MKIKHLIIMSFFLCFKCHSLQLSSDDTAILNNFFRCMFYDSEAGYVLLDTKPVCNHGYFIYDRFSGHNCPLLKEQINLREGARTLKKLNLTNSEQKYIIHIYNNPDSCVKNCVHILFINRELFLKTVQSNIILFQYVLGPDVTPVKLLEKLIDPNETFYSVINEDKVLIGILLGFGTQNSLYGSRYENIEEALVKTESLPLNKHLADLKNRIFNSSSDSKLKPTFGHLSINEEMQNIFQKISLSSEKLIEQKPIFCFGKLKEDKETVELIEDLEKSQIEINKLLSTENFLKKTLDAFYPNQDIQPNKVISNQLAFKKDEIEFLPELIAANIWQLIDDETKVFQEAYIEGIKEANKTSPIRNDISEDMKCKEYIEQLQAYEKYEQLKKLVQVKENLQEVQTFFEALSKDSTNNEVYPLKLYYKILEAGEGQTLDNLSIVTMHYSIKNHENMVLANTWRKDEPVELNMADLITGLSYGMKGMKIGETREIYIHPSLAYGIYTTADKGVYLKARVELIEIDESANKEPYPDLYVQNTDNVLNPNLDSEFAIASKEFGYAKGYRIWEHYKMSKLYSLEDILSWIARYQSGTEFDISSQSDQDLINRIHWNIYNLENVSMKY